MATLTDHTVSCTEPKACTYSNRNLLASYKTLDYRYQRISVGKLYKQDQEKKRVSHNIKVFKGVFQWFQTTQNDVLKRLNIQEIKNSVRREEQTSFR